MCDNSNQKRCFVCGVEKQRTEFYAHPQMADGLLGKCKECTKMHSTRLRNAKLEQVREYDRDRRRGVVKPSHRKKCDRSASSRAWYKRNGEKKHAETVAYRAILRGELDREPCQMCGCAENIQAHHWDYSKPLDVVWLCVRHHNDLHMAIRDAERFNC